MAHGIVYSFKSALPVAVEIGRKSDWPAGGPSKGRWQPATRFTLGAAHVERSPAPGVARPRTSQESVGSR